MVEVTDRAAGKLESMLNDQNAPEQAGVRIVEDAGKFGMTVDAMRQGDEVVWHNERPVLIADGQVAQTLTGHTLDFQTAEDGRDRFQLL
jgi:Fe-S cluster assembly iron-binding protein IscA